MAKRYRVGIIGHTGRGDYGHAVDVAFLKVEAAEVVAVADANPTGLAAAQKRTGAKAAYAAYRDMLAKEKLDIVAVCPRWRSRSAARSRSATRSSGRSTCGT